MLHQGIREARERRGISVRELARVSGISRSQLQALEQGGNATLSTVEKALSQLGLRLAIVPADSQQEGAALDAAMEIRRRADQLIEALGGVAPSQPTAPVQGPAGATRYTEPVANPGVVAILEQAVAEIKKLPR